MPSTIRLHHIFHSHYILPVINVVLLALIALLVLTPVFDPALGWSDKKNLFAVLMVAGLALVPVSLLLSAYFAKGDPLVCPICKIVAAYNILAAGFLFYHVAVSPEIDALDMAYSNAIGIIAVVNSIALLLRLRKETAPRIPLGTHPDS